jgi:hypothetical protein
MPHVTLRNSRNVLVLATAVAAVLAAVLWAVYG